MVILFTAAIGLVAALAWDDAVKSVFQKYYPFPGTGIEAKFMYAFSVTIVAVLITTILASMADEDDQQTPKKRI